MITICQEEEGGWWEGTSQKNGLTGWFPSNFVVRFSHVEDDVMIGNENEAIRQSYRQQLMESLVDKERKFVEELETFQHDYLIKLEKEQM